MTELRTGTPTLTGPRRGALGAVLAVGAVLALALAALPFEGAAPLVAFGAFAVAGAVVVDRVGASHPHARLGVGNAVTLFRAGGAAVFAGFAAEPAALFGTGGWSALGGATALLALDGIDGWAARRQRLCSAFGARFDMEVDAALILALAVLAAGLGKAGPWVIGVGLLRYAFVLAGIAWPPLAAPLPPSSRRRAVCGLQIAVLALMLAPPLAPPWSAALAAVALATLAWSFAVDAAWLLRRAR